MRLIDRCLSALFRVADYVTSRCPILSTKSPAGNDLPPRTIRFSSDDVVMD
ncbi:MAG: hypothetical protein J6X07_00525 [Prevotella sp.]|nr:hypothetical protein [Prevotella sp.]